ncbi:ATP-dependent helicase HrpB [Rhodoblastus acidophilus]|uniref:ATP-dependent helicase HrpB n=1 Tax=Candidatus Rhodoblastus alkanivorans TaxID=2954117 RepID=A0ABS9Z378_9HYPH|nr:ATP-dependent helicase HrpB [Candidatus Rhodoblastus alkanivorans]MCI4677373.1 ATP-dependent helicase HrpB [Candidatus Rhodoblastus alkanivorans]MCI4682108.1 ATP-dependent helicase HrpB [Candidatus Rhodoblastus alkanivorans]MDI4639410.1 ATP-dependent helicase HrpB [Rhodoblastus acidophilus]
MIFDPPRSAPVLPIDEALPRLAEKLEETERVVLVAPPGAGKTTRVPLALLDARWRGDGKIVVLEPRRLAARAAAERMSTLMGDKLGETIGLKVRLQSLSGPKTRIEVVTEGVFARMILDDPSLEGVAAVLFDEFHERSLDADLGLALALDAQAALRPDLRLLVMSATLDGARVAKLMRDAPIVESQGRAFPVETVYLGRDPRERIEDAAARAVRRALAEQPGSLLVFLPGQGEILRLAARLEENLNDEAIDVCPLYGAMERAAQDRAIRPAAEGRRKIVLATSIAETSITIDGVRVVIDCGLVRAPRFEPDLGLTRLETLRVSRAAADQRRGRAGRTQPGLCYRLWEEAATGALPAFAQPEILAADLSGLLLDLAAWGARDPGELLWLDPPPAPACAEARALLQKLGALDAMSAITTRGKAMRRLPLPPRLARMALQAENFGAGERACELAVVLSERGLGGDSPDLAGRLERFARDNAPRARDGRRLAHGWAHALRSAARELDEKSAPIALSPGALIALAFPDRIARARGKRGDFLMANGRAASLEPSSPLAGAAMLAVAEVVGRAGASQIVAAAELAVDEFETLFGAEIVVRDETRFDAASGGLRRRETRRFGALTLAERNLPVEASLENAQMLARAAAAFGLDRLGWSKAQGQLRERVAFLRGAFSSEGDNPWPDLSEAGLAENPEEWLAPFILGRQKLDEIAAENFDAALAALIPWDLARRLEAEAPTHFVTPAGSAIALDYGGAEGPVLAVRVQELYGLAIHPSLAGGRAPLTLHLLSPAHRPIQITRDLPGFWKGSWAAVKAEMKGRYPRHVWPDDPAAAAPTTRAKPRGS